MRPYGSLVLPLVLNPIESLPSSSESCLCILRMMKYLELDLFFIETRDHVSDLDFVAALALDVEAVRFHAL